MKIKAAILEKPGSPLRIIELNMPSLKKGQVFVDVCYSGVCRSQLMEADGKRGHDAYLPHLLGHEGSGTVIDTGSGVTKVKSGSKVILGWIKSHGLDVKGPVFRDGHRTINAGSVTTFCTHAIVSENRCVKVPRGIPMNVAVLFGCAIPTGAGIVMNQIKPAAGETIAVFGLGGVGLSALMAAQLYSPKVLLAVDISENKLAHAKSFGATHVLNASSKDLLASALQLTNGKGFDHAIDASGRTDVIELAFKAIRKGGGHCVFASHPEAGKKIRLDPYDLICGRRIEGSWGGASMPDKDIPRIARLFREGKLPLDKLLSNTYSLWDINKALRDLRKGLVTRALIDMNIPEDNNS